MGEAVGIVELFGLVAAFAAADAGCKAADVRLEPFDKNKPANADALPVPLIVAVKFRGSGGGCGKKSERDNRSYHDICDSKAGERH